MRVAQDKIITFYQSPPICCFKKKLLKTQNSTHKGVAHEQLRSSTICLLVGSSIESYFFGWNFFINHYNYPFLAIAIVTYVAYRMGPPVISWFTPPSKYSYNKYHTLLLLPSGCLT